MRKLFLTILLLQSFSFAESQFPSTNPDSLKLLADKTNEDTLKVRLYADLGYSYAFFFHVDSSIAYSQKAISLARQIQFKPGEAWAMFCYGWSMWASGNYDKAIEAALKSSNLFKALENYEQLMNVYNELAVFYRDAGDFAQSLRYGKLVENSYDLLKNTHEIHVIVPYVTIASAYLGIGQIDSASFYINKEFDTQKLSGEFASGYTYDVLGDVETRKKNYQTALSYYDSVLYGKNISKNNLDVLFTYFLKAQLYREMGNMDSSIWYAKSIVNKPEFSRVHRAVLEALTVLAEDYRLMKDDDSTLKYLELKVALNDSLFNREKSRAIQNLTFNEELRQQEMETTRKQYQSQVRLYAVFALSGVFLLIGIILYRNNKLKQKANTVLQQEKQKVETTLRVLESTQSQLIQSEKMASLGELTAGIAHEIQNPLNFINNFSEVNKELIEEMEREIENGSKENLRSIAMDVKNNEEKINHHGKRADAIVKGMLQHSRTSSGQKELTDINALAEEYLRLSYHGLRAKDKSFNATLQTDFDFTIGKINIMPQDIGRVLLNLYNNAFYEIAEKKKQHPEGYEPVVSVMTKKAGEKVLISIKDNGNGIPQKVLDKIFQPFFTTKPTGQGTGLGLSMSYDIIRAHGGELKVVSMGGEGAEFVVQIPAI
jgi:two-component system, NtrC family, sensor kinase